MKKVFYLFSLVLSFALFSCNKENLNPREPENPVVKKEVKTDLSLNIKYPEGFDFTKEVLTIKLVEQTSKEELAVKSPKDNKAITVQLKKGTYSLSIDNENYSAVKEAIVVGDKALTLEVELVSKGPKMTALTLNINFPKGIEFTEDNPFTIKLKNLVNEKEQVITATSTEPINISLEEGKYSLVMGNKAYAYEQKELEVKGESLALDNLNLENKFISKGFVFKEIHYTSSFSHAGSINYLRATDNYFELYNNSDKTLYLDGLCYALSELKTNKNVNPFTADKYKGKFLTDGVLQFPGTGKDYPVEPGKSVLIAVGAAVHKPGDYDPNRGPLHFDLSSADFGFLSPHTPSFNLIIDGSGFHEVPGMKYLNLVGSVLVHGGDAIDLSIGFMGNRDSHIIFRAPEGVDLAEYFKDKRVEEFFMRREYTAIMVPEEWVLDAVETGDNATEIAQKLLPSYLDAGYTYCNKPTEYIKDPIFPKEQIAANFENSYLRVSTRKVLKTMEDGRVVLKDTNNSTEDFEHNAKATKYLKETPPVKEMEIEVPW